MKCLECKKDINQTPGKRKREFCNSTCRSNYWQKKKRKEIIATPTVKVADLTKPTHQKKPPEQPKTNYSINTDGVKKPRNLAELRAMMPPDLDQWGKTEWMQIQRKKFGI